MTNSVDFKIVALTRPAISYASISTLVNPIADFLWNRKHICQPQKETSKNYRRGFLQSATNGAISKSFIVCLMVG